MTFWVFVYAVKMCYSFILLICISLMINNADSLFMCLLAICMSFLRKMSFHVFCPFFDMVFFFWHLVVWASYIFWILTPYQSYELQNFSPIQKVVFLFCQWFPLLCKSLCLIRLHLFIFAFIYSVLGDRSRKHSSSVCQRVLCLYFLLGVLWYILGL